MGSGGAAGGGGDGAPAGRGMKEGRGPDDSSSLRRGTQPGLAAGFAAALQRTELVTRLASAVTHAGAQLFKGTLSLPFAFLLFLWVFFPPSSFFLFLFILNFFLGLTPAFNECLGPAAIKLPGKPRKRQQPSITA